MKGSKSRVEKYARMSLEQLRRETAEFDREMAIDHSRALTRAERRTVDAARRKPGRPRQGAGVKVISVSVERRLLAQSTALARRLGISRAALVERGLRAVLAAEGLKAEPPASSRRVVREAAPRP